MGLTRLTARLAPWPAEVLDKHAELLTTLADGVGGPYHVVLPEQFAANMAAFRAALAESGVDGQVYYAKKANKAAAWVRHCAETRAGVDVASVGEACDALAAGVRGDFLVVTGPAKSAELLRLAILHGALITVDAPDELARVADIADRLDHARVLLRRLPDSHPHSRFGMTDAELDEALASCAPGVRVEGFSVHLSGYDTGQRAQAGATLVDWCLTARALGHPASAVSIGGGFATNYLDAPTWAGFAHDPADFHAGRTFGGGFYPYHSPVAGADALRSVLTTPVPDGTFAEKLRANAVRLHVEPGRALLDQAGFTVFRVQGVKDRGHGIVTVDGTSLSLSEQWFDSEFLPDPILLADRAGEPFTACVGGASCLESDMLTWRKVPFPTRPRVGDLLVYPNTAGYQMDSNESPFHELPLPPKIALTRAAPIAWRFDRTPTTKD